MEKIRYSDKVCYMIICRFKTIVGMSESASYGLAVVRLTSEII